MLKIVEIHVPAHNYQGFWYKVRVRNLAGFWAYIDLQAYQEYVQ
jgi:hypothetical protein